jgi:integrase
MARHRRGRNEGTIRERADGRWEARLKGEDGKYKVHYARTRAEVQDWLIDTLKARKDGLPIGGSERQTVGQFLTHWLEHSAKPTIRPSTYRGYEEKIRVHLNPVLGKVRLRQLTPQIVQAFFNEKHQAGLAPRTVYQLRAVLRSALNDGLRWGLVARNAAALAEGPRIRHEEIQPLSPHEAKTLLDVISGDRLEALYSVALAVGLRQGEALGLHWADVDLEAGTLRVRTSLQQVNGEWQFVEPKTSRSRRTIALPEVAVVALRAHKDRQEFERRSVGTAWQDAGSVFTTPTGEPLRGTNVTKGFQKLLKEAGLPRQRFHDLRHGCASLLLAQGVHPRVVMETLGHSTISLTMNTYSHVMPELQREAAAKMDAALSRCDSSAETGTHPGRR